MKIFIDPQFGSTIYGGRVQMPDGSRVYGKDITFSIAMYLKELIERATYNQVFLSRQGDECISKERNLAMEGIERAFFCRKLNCDVAISIGVRWNRQRKEDRGSSIVYTRVKTTRSRYLAGTVLKHLVEETGIPNKVFTGAKTYFLMACNCEGVDIKPVTLSNPQDFEFIIDPNNQYKTALAIFNALKEFYGLRFKLKSDII